MQEAALRLGDFRGFTPSDTESEGGTHGGLAEGCNGDWSWKPHRDARRDHAYPFYGVPASVIESLGRARVESGAQFFPENEVFTIRKYARLIPGAHGGQFDTLAGVHVS